MLKPLSGVIESHPLSQFLPGYVYEVSESFGLQLMEMGAAIEVRSTDPAVGTNDIDHVTGGIVVVPADKAADRPERRRRKRR